MFNNDAEKRKRGGQPGNRNALKHGFYYTVLDEDQKQSLKQADELDGLDEEIGILRIQLKSVLKNNPENIRLISQMLAVLSRLLHTRIKLAKDDRFALQKAIENVLMNVAVPMGLDLNQICPDKMKEYLAQKNSNSR
jgi:hypothetical protein